MKRKDCTEIIEEAISQKGIRYQAIADEIGKSLIWTTLALLGQATMDKAEAEKAAAMLGLGDDVAKALQTFPTRGSLSEMPPSDPTQYRFYELIQVYGTTLKAVINEKFGDGIMSAIDF